MINHNGETYLGGWKEDEEGVVRVLSTMEKPLFSSAAPHLSGSGDKKDVLFWEFEEKATGKIQDSWNQKSVGSCVGFASARAVTDLLYIQIVQNNESYPGYDANPEMIYAGSRCEVGGWFGDYNDGSIGAYAAKFITNWGILYSKKYGNLDLSVYDENRCRQFGAKGVPDDLEPVAKERPVKQTALMQNVNQVRDAIANGYPVMICGKFGREMKRRPDGFCQVQGQWMHAQELCGVCVVKGNRPAIAYRNSWADYLGSANNKVTLESGREITLPMGVYLSDFDDVDKECRANDTFSYAHATGYPAQTFSWLI